MTSTTKKRWLDFVDMGPVLAACDTIVVCVTVTSPDDGDDHRGEITGVVPAMGDVRLCPDTRIAVATLHGREVRERVSVLLRATPRDTTACLLTRVSCGSTSTWVTSGYRGASSSRAQKGQQLRGGAAQGISWQRASCTCSAARWWEGPPELEREPEPVPGELCVRADRIRQPQNESAENWQGRRAWRQRERRPQRHQQGQRWHHVAEGMGQGMEGNHHPQRQRRSQQTCTMSKPRFLRWTSMRSW